MIAATAWSASGPVARTTTCWPLVAPSAITDSTLLASTQASPTAIWTAATKPAAATASEPAGRACRSPVSVMAASELSGIARLLGRREYRLDVAADGGRHRRGHRSLDERGVGERDRLGQRSRLGEQNPH